MLEEPLQTINGMLWRGGAKPATPGDVAYISMSGQRLVLLPADGGVHIYEIKKVV